MVYILKKSEYNLWLSLHKTNVFTLWKGILVWLSSHFQMGGWVDELYFDYFLIVLWLLYLITFNVFFDFWTLINTSLQDTCIPSPSTRLKGLPVTTIFQELGLLTSRKWNIILANFPDFSSSDLEFWFYFTQKAFSHYSNSKSLI